MQKFIYADNAATTSLSKPVLDEMLPYLTTEYGNASSLYSLGGRAKAAVDTARARVAAAIGAEAREIYFTGGGSESDNWAIKGIAEAMAKKGKKHIISTAFEHHAVLHTLEKLGKNGFEITLLPVYENGIIKLSDLEAAIKEDTALVTIMYAKSTALFSIPMPFRQWATLRLT